MDGNRMPRYPSRYPRPPRDAFYNNHQNQPRRGMSPRIPNHSNTHLLRPRFFPQQVQPNRQNIPCDMRPPLNQLGPPPMPPLMRPPLNQGPPPMPPLISQPNQFRNSVPVQNFTEMRRPSPFPPLHQPNILHQRPPMPPIQGPPPFLPNQPPFRPPTGHNKILVLPPPPQISANNENMPQMHMPPAQRPAHSCQSKPIGDKPTLTDNGSSPALTSPLVTMMNADKQWIQIWLNRNKIHQPKKTSSVSVCNTKMKIHDVTALLTSTYKLCQELKTITRDINAVTDENRREEKFTKAGEIKKQIDDMKKVLIDSSLQCAIQKKTADRRKERERKKRRRKQEYEETLKNQECQKEKHRLIDNWQDGIYNKIQETKTENELKGIADKTLAEVRYKTNDVKRGLEMLQSLQKLRSVRKDSKERKGLYTPMESDHMFEARLKMQRGLLEKQLKSYDAENRLIQVMLDTEKEEVREYDEEERKRTKIEKELQLEDKIRRVLFGETMRDEPFPPSDPLHRFYTYHNGANYSGENLYLIRKEWDGYIANEKDPLGTLLPSTWIVPPSEPSSEIWASALKS